MKQCYELNVSPQVCQQLPEYGILLYRVMREKKPQEGEIILGVCAKGVVVYEIKDGCRSTSQNFYWRDTATISSSVSCPMFFFTFRRAPHRACLCRTHHVSLQRRRFVVESRAGKKKYIYITERSKTAKYLCNLCSAQHKFNNEMSSRQLSHSLVYGQLHPRHHLLPNSIEIGRAHV